MLLFKKCKIKFDSRAPYDSALKRGGCMRYMHEFFKIVTVAFVIVLIANPSFAADKKRYIRKDPWRSDSYVIQDSYHRNIGSIRKDPWDSRKMQIYDKTGKRKGYLQKEAFPSSGEKSGIYNQQGKKTGSIKLDIWRPHKDTYFIIDDKRKQKGIARKDKWQDGLWVIEE